MGEEAEEWHWIAGHAKTKVVISGWRHRTVLELFILTCFILVSRIDLEIVTIISSARILAVTYRAHATFS